MRFIVISIVILVVVTAVFALPAESERVSNIPLLGRAIDGFEHLLSSMGLKGNSIGRIQNDTSTLFENKTESTRESVNELIGSFTTSPQERRTELIEELSGQLTEAQVHQEAGNVTELEKTLEESKNVLEELAENNNDEGFIQSVISGNICPAVD